MIRTTTAIALLLIAYPLQAQEWPSELTESPEVTLPISVGRTWWRALLFDYSDKDEFTHRIAQVREEIYRLSGNGFFGMNSDYWEQWDFMEKNLRIGQLPCRDGLGCYIVSDTPVTFLVTVKAGLIVDATLVNADHKEYDDQGKERHTDQLDSTFGDGTVWQPLPITRFEETGIFCTDFIFYNEEGIQEARDYKRRITEEGLIETKEVDLRKNCKAPW